MQLKMHLHSQILLQLRGFKIIICPDLQVDKNLRNSTLFCVELVLKYSLFLEVKSWLNILYGS